MIRTVGDLMKLAVKECHLSIAILIKDIVLDMEGIELKSSIEDIGGKVLEYYGFECKSEESKGQGMDNPYKNRKCFECADLRYDEELGYYCSDDSESLWEGCGVKSDTPACECFTERTKGDEILHE